MDNRTCSVAGCEREWYGKGLCKLHGQRMRRTGTVEPRRNMSLEERFWPKVSKGESCWSWTGAKNPEGYGNLPRPGGSGLAHRISYEMHTGPIPSGSIVDHMCHNTSCVNPEHLRLVTNKQNQEHRSGAQVNSSTGILGVSWKKRDKKWQAGVTHNGVTIHGGYFATAKEAERRVIELRRSLFTHNDLDRASA